MRILMGMAIAAVAALPIFAQTETQPERKTGAVSGGLPDIVARSWAGETVDIHNLNGNPILLIFWEKPPSGC